MQIRGVTVSRWNMVTVINKNIGNRGHFDLFHTLITDKLRLITDECGQTTSDVGA